MASVGADAISVCVSKGCVRTVVCKILRSAVTVLRRHTSQKKRTHTDMGMDMGMGMGMGMDMGMDMGMGHGG